MKTDQTANITSNPTKNLQPDKTKDADSTSDYSSKVNNSKSGKNSFIKGITPDTDTKTKSIKYPNTKPGDNISVEDKDNFSLSQSSTNIHDTIDLDKETPDLTIVENINSYELKRDLKSLNKSKLVFDDWFMDPNLEKSIEDLENGYMLNTDIQKTILRYEDASDAIKYDLSSMENDNDYRAFISSISRLEPKVLPNGDKYLFFPTIVQKKIPKNASFFYRKIIYPIKTFFFKPKLHNTFIAINYTKKRIEYYDPRGHNDKTFYRQFINNTDIPINEALDEMHSLVFNKSDNTKKPNIIHNNMHHQKSDKSAYAIYTTQTMFSLLTDKNTTFDKITKSKADSPKSVRNGFIKELKNKTSALEIDE